MKYFFWQSLLLLAIPAFVLGGLIAWWMLRRSYRRVTHMFEVGEAEATSGSASGESVHRARMERDDTIAELRRDLADIRKQLEAQRAEATAAHSARAEATTLANERLRQLEQARRDAGRPAPSAATAAAPVVEAVAVAAVERERAERTEASLSSLREEFDRARTQHGETVSAVAKKADDAERAAVAARGELEKVRAESAAQLQGLRTRAERAENALQTDRTEHESYLAAHAELERTLADWRTRAETAEGTLSPLREQLQTERSAREDAQRSTTARTADLQNSLSVLRAEHDRFTRATAASSQDLRSRAELAEQTLTTQQSARDRRVRELESELASLRVAHAEARGNHERAVAEASMLRGRLAELDASPVGTVLRAVAAGAAPPGQPPVQSPDRLSAQGLVPASDQAPATDDLERIEGIGPKMAQALAAGGIRTYAHVRDAPEARLRSAIERAGLSFAPSLPTWPKQSSYLAAGDEHGFRQYTEYLIAGRDPSEWTDADTTTEANTSGHGAGPESVETTPPHQLHDDLERVEGIGPRISAALHGAGLHTFGALAHSSENRLRSALAVANVAFAPSLGTWAQQARFLAAGDESGFERYVAHLIAGRDRQDGQKP